MNRREFTKLCSLAAVASLTGIGSPAILAQDIPTPAARRKPYILGADISWLLEDEAQGAAYFDRGIQKDMFDILKTYGINFIRARMFVNPSAPGGYSRQSFCDLAHTKIFAKRIKDAAMGFLLSIHYSDTWSSPAHQAKPAAWANLAYPQLVDMVHSWTSNVMQEMKANNTIPDMVSIGNETTSGMLFPDGRASNPDHFAELINAGSLAVRDLDKNIPIAVHSHLGRDNAAIVKWVDNFLARKTQIDVIGMSCYSQSRPGDWERNFNDISVRYPHLSFAAMEYSYEKRYLNDLIFNAPNGKGIGSFIWEPTRWREAIFDHNGMNAGDDENNRPHLPASTLPLLSDANQPKYVPAKPPSYAGVDGGDMANTRPAPGAPPAARPRATSRPGGFAPGTQPTTRRGFGRTRGGRYDTNSFMLAYTEMAKAYGL